MKAKMNTELRWDWICLCLLLHFKRKGIFPSVYNPRCVSVCWCSLIDMLCTFFYLFAWAAEAYREKMKSFARHVTVERFNPTTCRRSQNFHRSLNRYTILLWCFGYCYVSTDFICLSFFFKYGMICRHFLQLISVCYNTTEPSINS